MDQLLVLAFVLGVLCGAAVLLLTLSRRPGRRARLAPDGAQELEIVVLRGYTPDVAIVREGIPVRLKFTRLENESCSDRVVFSDLKVNRRLPPYRTTAVEFAPPDPGEYLFTCAMGMYRGRLVVEAASGRRRPPTLGRGAVSERRGTRAE